MAGRSLPFFVLHRENEIRVSDRPYSDLPIVKSAQGSDIKKNAGSLMPRPPHTPNSSPLVFF